MKIIISVLLINILELLLYKGLDTDCIFHEINLFESLAFRDLFV